MKGQKVRVPVTKVRNLTVIGALTQVFQSRNPKTWTGQTGQLRDGPGRHICKPPGELVTCTVVRIPTHLVENRNR